MAQSGLSKARLGRLHDAVQSYVDIGENIGVVTVIERRGETYVDVVGLADRERNVPLKRDAIFRIASMTKPITAVATLILVEECKLRLDEPISRLMPELANPRVLKRPDAELDDTEPLKRPITVRHLLTFTFGHGFAMGSGPTPLQRALDDNQLFTPPSSPSHTPDEWIKRLGSLSLAHQPGERWMYHIGSDVLGVLIARVSGKPLGDFMKERIFDPLGMKDTGFSVPPNKISRLANAYTVNPQSGKLDLVDDWKESLFANEPVFPMGGAGLVSTTDDYLAFARMLLNGGKLGKERILARPSVEAMTTDQVSPAVRGSSGLNLNTSSYGYGFGVGMGMFVNPTSTANPLSSYGWSGGYGTTWSNDPRQEMITILMQQRGGGMAPGAAGLSGDFPTLAYQAIDD